MSEQEELLINKKSKKSLIRIKAEMKDSKKKRERIDNSKGAK